ncbi:MAG: glycosyl hydrolase-related protein, partial [Planctomycetota bacterium]
VLSNSGSARVQVSAFKDSEDGGSKILRLFECHGGHGTATIDWHMPVGDVQGVDLLERRSEHVVAVVTHIGNRTTVQLKPFQIVTLRIT